MEFSFAKHVPWLMAKVAELQRAGYTVKVITNPAEHPTVHLKIDHPSCLAALTVWDYGATDMGLVEIPSVRWVMDRSDLRLTEDNWQAMLGSFFDAVIHAGRGAD